MPFDSRMEAWGMHKEGMQACFHAGTRQRRAPEGDPGMMSDQGRRNYPLLLAGQFLGAFGDNAILAVIVGQLTLLKNAGAITDEVLRGRGALYTSLLFVPYVLLAPLAGYLNDRFSKTTWLVGGNAIKVLGTAICGLSVWHGYGWQAPGYLVVGVGSCFYGPAKYGILPEILPAERLVKANGTVELLTLLAIITGAIGGSVMVDRLPVAACYGLLLAIFGGGWLLNLAMDRTPSGPGVRLGASVAEFGVHAGALLGDGRMARVLLGTALFWVCGAAMKINFQAWGLGVLGLRNNTQVSLLGLWLSVGVMVGSVLAGMWHRVGDLSRTRRYGALLVAALVAMGLVEFVGPLRASIWAHGVPWFPWVMVLLVGAGVAAGLFLIPLNAALQAETDPARLGKTIAVQNLCDNVGMLLAGGLVAVCVRSGDWLGMPVSAGQFFFVLAALVGLALAGLGLRGRVQGG